MKATKKTKSAGGYKNLSLDEKLVRIEAQVHSILRDDGPTLVDRVVSQVKKGQNPAVEYGEFFVIDETISTLRLGEWERIRMGLMSGPFAHLHKDLGKYAVASGIASRWGCVMGEEAACNVLGLLIETYEPSQDNCYQLAHSVSFMGDMIVDGMNPCLFDLICKDLEKYSSFWQRNDRVRLWLESINTISTWKLYDWMKLSLSPEGKDVSSEDVFHSYFGEKLTNLVSEAHDLAPDTHEFIVQFIRSIRSMDFKDDECQFLVEVFQLAAPYWEVPDDHFFLSWMDYEDREAIRSSRSRAYNCPDFVSRCVQIIQSKEYNTEEVQWEGEKFISIDAEKVLECASIESKYQVCEKLGQGVAGKVYKVFSSELKRYQALKVIEPGKVNPDEAELLGKLRGEELNNIVQVIDAGEDIATVRGERRYSVVMEYVDGMLLTNLMKNAQLQDYWTCRLSSQILDGILALRSHGITHRDIYPENIKVNSSGLSKIIDFGTATIQDKPKGRDARRYGSPSHMEASDIFSLGLITYEMAAGKHFIVERTQDMDYETFASAVEKEKESIYRKNGNIKAKFRQRIRENIPKMLQPIVFACLEHYDDVHHIIGCYEVAKEAILPKGTAYAGYHKRGLDK